MYVTKWLAIAIDEIDILERPAVLYTYIHLMMEGSQEWLRRTMVGSRAQPTGRMVPSSQD